MISHEDLTLIQVWVEGNKKVLEFSVNDRTFQVCGIQGASGLYERIFNKGSHPTRRIVGVEEMLEVLKKVSSNLEFYRGPKGSGRMFTTVIEAIEAAKKWCGSVQ